MEDEKSKELRYKLYKKIPNLSIKEKIEICKQYLTVIENSPEDIANSNVYLDLAELSFQAKLAAVSYYNFEESSYYFDRWFSLNNDQISCAEKIVVFCIKHGFEQDLIIWIKKYEDLCLRNKRSGQFSETLGKNLADLHRAGLAKKVFFVIDPILLTSGIARTLGSLHEFESAVYVYDQVANIEIKDNKCHETDLDRLAWLETVKYKTKYDVLVRSYDSNWTAIYVYDYCYSNDPVINEKINQLKQKYNAAFLLHRNCLSFIDYFHCQRWPEKQELYQRFIDTYEKEVSIIPQILAFFDEYGSLLKNKMGKYEYGSEDVFNIPLINVNKKYEYANCVVIKQLSISHEQSSHIDDALRVCEVGISCGYLDDGTKKGMLGRRARLLKKKGKTTNG